MGGVAGGKPHAACNQQLLVRNFSSSLLFCLLGRHQFYESGFSRWPTLEPEALTLNGIPRCRCGGAQIQLFEVFSARRIGVNPAMHRATFRGAGCRPSMSCVTQQLGTSMGREDPISAGATSLRNGEAWDGSRGRQPPPRRLPNPRWTQRLRLALCPSRRGKSSELTTADIMIRNPDRARPTALASSAMGSFCASVRIGSSTSACVTRKRPPFMASGFAKHTGQLGVCVGTTGLSSVHALNGLYDAHMDGAPVIHYGNDVS